MTPAKISPDSGILLVDDEKPWLRSLSILLERTVGIHRIVPCSDSRQALELLRQHAIDLVILDLTMPYLSGEQLLNQMVEEHPDLPIIILSGLNQIDTAVRCMRAGAFDYFVKTTEEDRLIAGILRALRMRALEQENRRLSSHVLNGELTHPEAFADIITEDPKMLSIFHYVEAIAPSRQPLLITGESGTGKELLARAIHQVSARAAGPFVGINCGSIPEPLLESELFGHVRGAFTGALQDYAGLFKSAQGGTLLLDEIGDMPLALQVKLLRVLQERQVRPVGSARVTPVDVRIISATHRNLEESIAAGQFRQDLYYRLNVVCFEVPNLAERREDIPLLAEYFRTKLAERSQKKITGFAPEAMDLLINAPWPGNIRELMNVVEQAVTLATTPVITADLVQRALRDTPERLPPLAEARRKFEQDYLVRLLQMTRGNVSQAARIA
ncbi:MAG: sigma-54 dependent transcriptional regulator, partial [Desulfuromonadaceae bacterium]